MSTARSQSISWLSLLVVGGLSPGLSLAEEVTLPQAFSYAADRVPVVVVALPAVTVHAGVSRVVEGRLTVHGPPGLTQPVLVAAQVACENERGAWTLANWQGASSEPAGVNVEVRTLLRGDRDRVVGCSLKVMSGAGSLPSGTMMRMEPLGAQLAVLDALGAPASVVGAPSAELAVGVMSSVLGNAWSMTQGASAVVVAADLQVSTCVPGAVARGWCTLEGAAGSSLVATRLVVVQLDAAGSTCRRVVMPTRLTSISNTAHHAKLSHDATVTLDARCAGGRVVSSLQVFISSGNPVKIEGSTASGDLQSLAFMGALPLGGVIE